jgi:hypothetical protein
MHLGFNMMSTVGNQTIFISILFLYIFMDSYTSGVGAHDEFPGIYARRSPLSLSLCSLYFLFFCSHTHSRFTPLDRPSGGAWFVLGAERR